LGGVLVGVKTRVHHHRVRSYLHPAAAYLKH
jgi:hypothetical protein